MNLSMKALAVTLFVNNLVVPVRAQSAAPAPRHISLDEAVQLALKHNHTVRIAGYKVDEKQSAKAVAKSAYFPTISNQSSLFHLTDTQLIQIGAGSLGTVAGAPFPVQPETINQGGVTLITSGTGLVQPLTPLFTRIKPANDAARAELNATRASAQETENEIALKVHEIYYQILIAQLHHRAIEAKIQASHDLEGERVEQVKYGSALDEQLIESRAQSLQAKQDLLTTELQVSDLTMQLDEVMGLPVTSALVLDPAVREGSEAAACEREECVKIALASHPEIIAARAEVEKASAGVRLAKADYIPDISAFARYSYSDHVPFLARNFGSFGVLFNYDLFDGGRRRAAVSESNARLAEARENLARATEEVELRVETAANRLERTRELVKVSEEILALRTESSRVMAQELQKGTALRSQADTAVAQEFDAKTLLLQSQLDYVQAGDEMTQAIGKTPE
jgi:outer membrane protein TolC